jgi:hypothetical protein
MKDFVEAHCHQVKGVLSCFDRMLFRGYLPIQDCRAMARLLYEKEVRFRDLKSFLVDNANKVKDRAWQLAKVTGRPCTYLDTKVPKERRARELAARDHIEEGLVCVFSVLEPCLTFSFRFEKGKPRVGHARRRCLSLYYYFMDRHFGLIHIKIQTWFPMVVQVYVNGQEWLARKLAQSHITYAKVDNVFVHVGDFGRAQAFADRLSSLHWPQLLNSYAQRVNPLLADILQGQNYYWVTAQSEYATDVLFKSRSTLQDLYPRLLSHATLCFGAKEVMSFLGRKLYGQFEGEIITDTIDLAHKRIQGARIKHRVKGNWIKMYDKAGTVLRVEMVINNPEEFRVRKRVMRSDRPTTEWVQMRKGVGYLFRYRDVSRSANRRYLNALAVVSDLTLEVRQLESITRNRRTASGRTAKAFNPLSREDVQLFRALMGGEHHIRGFNNRDLRLALAETAHLAPLADDPPRQSAKVSRILHRFHLHGLVAKIPHSRRWRTTRFGRRVMATSIQIQQLNFPQLLALAA